MSQYDVAYPAMDTVGPRPAGTPFAMAAVARRNAAAFIAVLIFQDVFLLTLHRLALNDNWLFYRISRFDIATYLLYSILAVVGALLAVLFCRGMKVVPKFYVNRRLIQLFVAISIAVNLLSFGMVDANARYVSGALTGAVGAIYALSQAFSLAAMLLTVKSRINKDGSLPIAWAIAVAGSYAANIDGLASAMTLSAYIILIFGNEIKLRNVVMLLIGTIAAVLSIVVGFSRKFTALPSYMTPEYMVKWLISRLAIAAEQGYTYISGESVLNRSGEYSSLILRSLRDRYDILTGGSPIIVFPRSVSEALYYDMYGLYDAGSSPGFFLGLILNGLFAIPILYIFCFITVQMFYGIQRKFALIGLIALVLTTKMIYANISEYFVIVAPATLGLVLFAFACFVEPRPGKAR